MNETKASTAVILETKALPWLFENNRGFRHHIETRLLDLLFGNKTAVVSHDATAANLQPK